MKTRIFLAFLLFAIMVPNSILAIGPGCGDDKSFSGAGGSQFIRLPCFFYSQPGPAGRWTALDLIFSIINIALLIIGSLAVLFLIFGGYRYVTSFGNEEAAESAKKIIRNALLGILIVILSFVVITVVLNLVIAGKP